LQIGGLKGGAAARTIYFSAAQTRWTSS